MLNKFTLHCHLHDLITNYGGCIVLCRHERFISWGLPGCWMSCLCCLNQIPGKDYCPVAGSHLSVSWNTQFQWLVLVLLLWPVGQHVTCDSLLEQKETGGNGQQIHGRTGQMMGKKYKTLDSGGNQRQVEEINVFVHSKIDYTLAAGIDVSKISFVAVLHQWPYGSTVKGVMHQTNSSCPHLQLNSHNSFCPNANRCPFPLLFMFHWAFKIRRREFFSWFG